MKRYLLGAFLALAALPALAQAPMVTQPFGVTTAQSGGTITAGGTFQTILAANANRKGCTIQNTSANVLYVFFGSGTPTTTNSFQVPAGSSINCQTTAGVVLTEIVRGTTSTTNDTYVLSAQ